MGEASFPEGIRRMKDEEYSVAKGSISCGGDPFSGGNATGGVGDAHHRRVFAAIMVSVLGRFMHPILDIGLSIDTEDH